jgi:cytochrome c-type biogenesis protein
VTGAVLAGAASTFQGTAGNGPLLLAVGVAVLAGLVSFLSPCVLPLVPGYLSFVTGMSGADLAATSRRRPEGPGASTAAVAPGGFVVRSRVLVGSLLFVLGFSAVFVTTGAVFGGVGLTLQAHAEVVSRVLGGVAVLLGLAFLGLVPGLQRDLRVHRLPAAGLAGAPLLGVVFGVGWTPCVGPTLGVVLGLATDPHSASPARGALLTAAYCVGLGLPFVLAGVAFRRVLGAFAVVKRHYALVTRLGGALLLAVGLLLVTGTWDSLTRDLQGLVSGFNPPV